MSGRLTLVGTPIGNLSDISNRAVEALRSAEIAFCEDTRRARKLYSALAVPAPPLVRLDGHAEAADTARVVRAVEAGKAAVLITDAGMPVVSDPGAAAVRAVVAAGGAVEIAPGPDSVATALALSGLPGSEFVFLGFLPRRGAERSRRLEEVASSPRTVVLFEAPGRLAATLGDLLSACGPEREAVVARELTKLHEEVRRGNLADAAGWYEGAEVKGEIVVLLGPAVAVKGDVSDEELSTALASALASGLVRREAIAEVARAFGVPKRRVYDQSLRVKSG